MSNVLEVGILTPGTTELMFTRSGSSYKGWSYGKPNVAGGIGVKHEIYNASEKGIKYITFVYVPYNQVGDAVACTTTGQIEVRGKLTGPIKPDEKSEVQWDVLWYNPTITKVTLKEVIIQYMDDTQITINGEDIKNIDSHDSVYYEKHGKQEEAIRAAAAKAREEKRKAEEEKIKADKEKENAKNCYKSFLVLKNLKEAKNNENIRFHTNQGLILFALEVLGFILGNIPHVGVFIALALWIFAAIFSVKGIIDIKKGVKNELPLIGKIKLLK